MNYKIKMNKISTFVFDIDGVLTDGKVYLIGDQTARAVNSRDGFVMQFANKLGYNIFVISGGTYLPVKARLEEQGAKEVHMGANRKLPVLEDILSRYELEPEEVLYMGDDLPDIQCLKAAGLSCCPQNAVVDVKALVDYVSPYDGGNYCVRDVIEQTLRVQGKWDSEERHVW